MTTEPTVKPTIEAFLTTVNQTFPNEAHAKTGQFESVEAAVNRLTAKALGLNYHNAGDAQAKNAEDITTLYGDLAEPDTLNLARQALANAELLYINASAQAGQLALTPLKLLEQQDAQDTTPPAEGRQRYKRQLAVIAALQGITAGQATLYGLEHIAQELQRADRPGAARMVSKAHMDYGQSMLEITTELMVARNNIEQQS